MDAGGVKGAKEWDQRRGNWRVCRRNVKRKVDVYFRDTEAMGG